MLISKRPFRFLSFSSFLLFLSLFFSLKVYSLIRNSMVTLMPFCMLLLLMPMLGCSKLFLAVCFCFFKLFLSRTLLFLSRPFQGVPTLTSSFSPSPISFSFTLEEDAVISDALNHASIIDGIRLCKAKRFRYKNRDLGKTKFNQKNKKQKQEKQKKATIPPQNPPTTTHHFSLFLSFSLSLFLSFSLSLFLFRQLGRMFEAG